MTNFSANKNTRISPLNDPLQPSHFRTTTQQLSMLTIRQTVWVSGADIDPFSARPNQLLAHVWISGSPSKRFIPKNEQLVEVTVSRHKEPLTLTDECLVATPVSLLALDAATLQFDLHSSRLQSFKCRLHVGGTCPFRHGGNEPVTFVVSAQELVLLTVLARHQQQVPQSRLSVQDAQVASGSTTSRDVEELALIIMTDINRDSGSKPILPVSDGRSRTNPFELSLDQMRSHRSVLFTQHRVSLSARVDSKSPSCLFRDDILTLLWKQTTCGRVFSGQPHASDFVRQRSDVLNLLYPR